MNARPVTPLLAMAMVLAAAAFGVPALYVPGFALLLAIAVACIWVRLAALRARLDVESGQRTVVEDEAYFLRVRARSGWVPLPGGVVTHRLAQGPVPIDASPPQLEITNLRRGWRRVDPATLVVADPLGLARTRVQAAASPSVLVLPRIENVVLRAPAMNGVEDAIPGGAQVGHGAALGKRALDFEVDGLRTFRPGTPASRIHWPILARTGELVERRLVGGAGDSPVVVLDAEHPVDGDALDRAVRAAASLCFHLASAAGCLLVLPGERVPLRIDRALRAWPQAHACLALVQACATPPDPRIVRTAGAAFWVSGTGTIPSLPPALAGGTAYLVAAAPVDLGEAAFTVAGCEGHALSATRVRPESRAA